MEVIKNVRCECCDLSVPQRLASANRNTYGLIRGWICRACNEHRGNPVRTAQEHEYEVRVRWGETVDELHAALDRADDYHKKMLAAYKSRDRLLRQIEKLDRHHHETGRGCVCGKQKCEVLAILDEDWINDHIGRLHRREVN